jgi:hypothetical protein
VTNPFVPALLLRGSYILNSHSEHFLLSASARSIANISSSSNFSFHLYIIISKLYYNTSRMNFTWPGCAHRNGSGFIQRGMEINPYSLPGEFDAK